MEADVVACARSGDYDVGGCDEFGDVFISTVNENGDQSGSTLKPSNDVPFPRKSSLKKGDNQRHESKKKTVSFSSVTPDDKTIASGLFFAFDKILSIDKNIAVDALFWRMPDFSFYLVWAKLCLKCQFINLFHEKLVMVT